MSVAGTEPETESPGQAVGSRVVSVVAGVPFPEVSTFCSSARSSAWVSAIRTSGSLVARPSAWLYHCSPSSAGVSAENRPALSRRSASGPMIDAALRSPDSNRFAEVVSFWTIFITIVAGMPSVAVVAPFGPQV